MLLMQDKGIMICPHCGIQQKVLINSDKPSYREAPREISYFAYKRIKISPEKQSSNIIWALILVKMLNPNNIINMLIFNC